ncbi:flagellar basal body L-ring protein FlgH [Pseudoblastomonas halimionae]|uniref:Flagellar L-ring protein n=1 Tax=Alteriqipengyuania halimionae TaxID=1926630 RepID=A0A6I4U2Y0_9SPHN|nr:flagellar basal body L-ring protein FlgH [Alteriqipengyuania halimionae]MXP10429.1 flagellar basal body L-ring protein FlgH [Alteriqipengyuania halimionae]
MKKYVLIVAAASLVSGCGTLDRLKNVGKAPAMSPTAPITVPAYEPSIASRDPARQRSALPTAAAPVSQAPSASLFRSGAGELFQDQRASRVGDILTVDINISDKAEFGNSTSRSRNGSESVGIAALLGLQNILPGDPGQTVDTSSTSASGGQGRTSRSETINMKMAAIVTDVLPNGNLVIRGRQEMRVNFELRELIVTGIVRPQDIAKGNTIQHGKIAEARISYGGRGQLTDVQQARWGQQIYDALFPF